jgi:hypothetical protein
MPRNRPFRPIRANTTIETMTKTDEARSLIRIAGSGSPGGGAG